MPERQGSDDFRAAMPLMTFQGPVEDSDFMQSDEEEDPLESVLNSMKYRPQLHQPHDFWPSVLLSGGLCFVTGFIISYVAFIVGQKSTTEHQQAVKNINHGLGTVLAQLASEETIANFMSELREEGSEGEVSRIHRHFLGQGFDNAYVFNYTTLSFQADAQHSNKVTLLDEKGVEHLSPLLNVSTTFSVNSNDIMGQLVYVARGLAEDWLELEHDNVVIKGQIVVASTDALYPEDIAMAAYERGAAALLLYSPKQPNFNFWFPHSVSPGVGGIYQEQQSFFLPVASMETKDAETLLMMSMSSVHVDDSDGWKEGFPGKALHGTLRLQLHTLPLISPIYNVVAILGGTEEPDRYVIIGAHRTDARNGTAALMELARIFGKLKTSNGWRPHRTLILASWGGEGVTGAAALVSQFQQSLHARSVAYIDIHHITREPEKELIHGSPLLQQLLLQVAPFIPEVHISKLALKLPGHRSECPAFIHGTGTPCLSLLFSNETTLLSSVKIASISAWLLSDTSLLQYDLTALVKAITSSLDNLNSIYDPMLKEHSLTLRSLNAANITLAETVKRFEQHLDKTTIHTPVQLREVNDQLRQLAGSFLISHDSEVRDAFAWPSSVAEVSSSSGFGFLDNLLTACASPSHVAEHDRALKLQHHTAELSCLLESAAKLLLPPTQLI